MKHINFCLPKAFYRILFTQLTLIQIMSPWSLAWADVDYQFTYRGEQVTFRLPCKIEELNQRPEIILSGESHGDPLAEADKGTLLQQAHGRRLFLGLEGVHYKEDLLNTSPTFGIEEPFSHGMSLVGLFYLQAADALEEKDPQVRAEQARKIHTSLSNHIVVNERSQESLLLAKKLPMSEDFKELQALRQVESNKIKNGTEDEIRNMQSMLRDMLLQYLQMPYAPHKRSQVPRPANLDDSFEKFIEDPRKNFKYFRRIVKHWRNLHFAQHLLTEYCQKAKFDKKFAIIIGSKHIKGIKDILNSVFPSIPVSSRLMGDDTKNLLSSLGDPYSPHHPTKALNLSSSGGTWPCSLNNSAEMPAQQYEEFSDEENSLPVFY